MLVSSPVKQDPSKGFRYTHQVHIATSEWSSQEWDCQANSVVLHVLPGMYTFEENETCVCCWNMCKSTSLGHLETARAMYGGSCKRLGM